MKSSPGFTQQAQRLGRVADLHAEVGRLTAGIAASGRKVEFVHFPTVRSLEDSFFSPLADLKKTLEGNDMGAIKEATEKLLKTSMNNDQALWQQFKAQKGQAELAEAIASMKPAQ